MFIFAYPCYLNAAVSFKVSQRCGFTFSVTGTVMERPISRISSTPLKSRPKMTQPSTSPEFSSRSVKMTKSLPGSHHAMSPLR